MRRSRRRKKIQRPQAFVSDQTTLDGFALRSSRLDRLAEPGYVTKYDTKLVTFGNEYATVLASPFQHLPDVLYDLGGDSPDFNLSMKVYNSRSFSTHRRLDLSAFGIFFFDHEDI